MKAFSILGVFRAGWHDLRAHSALVFKVVLTLLAIHIASAIVGRVLEGTTLGFMAGVVLGVGEAVLGVGATVIALHLAERKGATYADIVPSWSLFWRMVGAGVLTALIMAPVILAALVIVGLQIFGALDTAERAFIASIEANPSLASELPVLLWANLAPSSIGVLVVAALVAIYLGLRYSLARFAVVDGAKVVESLKKSWHMSKGALLPLVLFILAAAALNIVGAIPFGLGLLVTIPLTMLAFAHAYLKLKNKA